MKLPNDENTKKQRGNTDKPDLIQSAISFLNDDTVKDASLTKKIEFLQSKGLNKEEIQYALDESQKLQNTATISNNNKNRHDTYFNNNNNNNSRKYNTPNYMYDILPPPLPERTWKDYFVMATVTAGLFYGLYEVTKRYVVPNILPASKNRLEKDKEEIKDQFDKIDKVLNEIEREHKEFKEMEQAKLDGLDATIEQLETSLEESKKSREKIDDDFRLLKLELSNLQNTLDKFMKNNQNVKEIENIGQEIMSLKNLIKSSDIFPQQQRRPYQCNNSIQDMNGSSHESSVDGSKNEPEDILSMPVTDGIPGIESIPSASELLAKFNKKKPTERAITNQGIHSDNDSTDDNNHSNDLENTTTPAWKKSREQTLLTMQQESNSNVDGTTLDKTADEMPEWQRMLQDTSD